MRDSFKQQLFAKHIIVNDSPSVENNFEALFSLANLLNIRVTKGQELANLDTFTWVANYLGRHVPDPFYVGFPQSVRNLTKEQLLFDQLAHYTVTYGFGDFSEAGHSLFNEQFERIAFRENVIIKEFVIISEEDAINELKVLVDNYLESTRPLSSSQYEIVKDSYFDYGFKFEECKCKNTAIRLLHDTKELDFVKSLNLSDFVAFVESLNYYFYSNKKVKNLNLKNQDRKFVTKVLDLMLEGDFHAVDCYEKQAIWCGILHHIHYKPKSEKAKRFVEAMRSGVNKSISSSFEKEIVNGNVIKAVDVLLKRKGVSAVMRKMNYLLSRCATGEEFEYVLSALNNNAKNNLVLIQNIIQYTHYKSGGLRTFKFTKFEKLRTHIETSKEGDRRRSTISRAICDRIKQIYKDKLVSNLKGKLGKVYIEDGMENIAIPLQETTSMDGFGTLPKGSIINIENGKKVRAFIYWEKVNDIDLSAVGITEDFSQVEFSWRTMYSRQSGAITFSGDQTSGYDGGSEYFDIVFDKFKKEYPTIKYLVFSANVFSGTPFKDCFCRAGYMKRDDIDSGEIFEPKTVETSFDINCDSTMSYMFALDVRKRRFIWLNIAKDSSSIIAAQNSFAMLVDYLDLCNIINYKTLFTMLATELVDNVEDADVIVSDKTYEVKDGVEQIHSYDTDKVLKLLNE